MEIVVHVNWSIHDLVFVFGIMQRWMHKDARNKAQGAVSGEGSEGGAFLIDMFFTTNLLHPLYPLLHSSVHFLINMFVIRFVFVLDEVALFCSLS
jgi:hypothetical protein